MTPEERITNYMENGGFFNPEAMEHDKVRDLLIDCRDELQRLRADSERLDWLEHEPETEMHQPSYVGLFRLNLPVTRERIDAARKGTP
jgi:hypothetical protein